MAVIYGAPVQTNRMTQVLNAIDGGPAAGTIEIGTAAMAVVLCVITLSDPSGTVGGTPPNVAWTMSGAPKSGTVINAATAQTAAAARIKDSTGTIVASGLTVTATGGGGNIELNSVSLINGQTVTLTAGTITHANT